MTCGVYEIVNKMNGKRYVGSSVNIENRWGGHRFTLIHGTHHNAHLQASWKKYGEKSFEFRVLQVCTLDELLDIEQEHLDKQSDYNIRPVADSNRGVRRTEEQKRHLSLINTGRTPSAETRKKLSEALMGNMRTLGLKMSDETKQKHVKAKKGIPNTLESRVKVSESLMGHKVSNESKKKMSIARKAYYKRMRSSNGEE